MLSAIILDSGVLALATQRPGLPEADACRAWMATVLQSGTRILVPAIARYEVRRELLRAGKTAGLRRLDAFIHAEPDRYLVLGDSDLDRAAQLWAQSRQGGTPNSDPKTLDIDVIVAAQALALNLPPTLFVVATSNVRHLARFVPADLWQNIQ